MTDSPHTEPPRRTAMAHTQTPDGAGQGVQILNMEAAERALASYVEAQKYSLRWEAHLQRLCATHTDLTYLEACPDPLGLERRCYRRIPIEPLAAMLAAIVGGAVYHTLLISPSEDTHWPMVQREPGTQPQQMPLHKVLRDYGVPDWRTTGWPPRSLKPKGSGT